MAPPATTKKTIKAQTIAEMRAMGAYRKEFDRLIDLYADLWEQYYELSKEYKTESGYQYKSRTADGGDKRSSLAVALENLRRDIGQYSDRLMLNPKARAEPGKTKGKSKLAELMRDSP